MCRARISGAKRGSSGAGQRRQLAVSGFRVDPERASGTLRELWPGICDGAVECIRSSDSVITREVEVVTHEAYNGSGTGKGTANININGHRNGASAPDIRHLYAQQLAEVRLAESHSAVALPDMAIVASDEDVASIFRAAASETEIQLERLDRLVRELDLPVDPARSPNRNGALADIRDIVDGNHEGDAHDIDTALLRSAREALRRQIAGYEAVCATARRLGDYRTLDVLLQSLDEELSTEASFSRLMSRHGRLLRAN